jgi:signal transduction histidine kinase
MSAADPRLASTRRPALRVSAPPAAWSRTLGPRLAPLIQASRLDELMTLVVRSAEEMGQAENGFLVLVDVKSRDVDFDSARGADGVAVRPARLRPLFARAGVLARLVHGVHVLEEEGGDTLLLLPLVHDSRLQAVLGVTPAASARPLGRAVEALRELCQQSAPLLARLREIAYLQELAGGLTVLAQAGAACETALRDADVARRSARMEAALTAELIASVNHALRTPLAAIRGYARLLREEPAGESQRAHLAIVARNVERLVDVAANLLGAARHRLQLGPVDVATCWRQVRAELEAPAAAREIALVEELPDAPVPLTADEAQLRRMLSELAKGVLETAGRGDRLRATLVDESRRIVVTITAAGEVDRSPGRSLRLDTAREIANLHGGRFAVVSESPQQRAYSVVLPRVSLEE